MKRLIIMFACLAFAWAACAKDVQWSQGYTADCDNATEREDGTVLPVSEIASVKYMIVHEDGGNPVYTAIMSEGCNPTFIDTRKYVPVGRYFLHGSTMDTDGRESVLSSPGVPLTVMKARPNPPGGMR